MTSADLRAVAQSIRDAVAIRPADQFRGSVRIDVLVNGGSVTLTLRPGKTLRWTRRTWLSDGYRDEEVEWTYRPDEDAVVRRSATTAVDPEGSAEWQWLHLAPRCLISGKEPQWIEER